MNRDCNGDFYTLDGQRFYRCLLDSEVVQAELLYDGNVCPRCLNVIVAEDHGEVAGRRVIVVTEVLYGGSHRQWHEHSLAEYDGALFLPRGDVNAR